MDRIHPLTPLFHAARPGPQGKLRSCAVGASQRLRRLFGPTAQVAVTEFSAGTFHMARRGGRGGRGGPVHGFHAVVEAGGRLGGVSWGKK